MIGDIVELIITLSIKKKRETSRTIKTRGVKKNNV